MKTQCGAAAEALVAAGTIAAATQMSVGGATLGSTPTREARMASKLNPYLHFNGNARDAMEFYRSVFGGTLTMSTFGEFGMAQDPGEQDKIMHGQLETDSGFTLMGADVPNRMGYSPPAAFAVSLSSDSEGEAELRGYWDKLSDGGTVSMPLDKAPWGDIFGMCDDRYGISWLVNIAGAPG